jgi:hypothetical protein
MLRGMSMATTNLIWSYCNRCSQDTKHDCLSAKEEVHDEQSGDFEYQWGKVSRFLECRGCEEVTLRVQWWHSEDDHSHDVTFYPPRISRQAPKWHLSLPHDWQSLLREVYAALHANSRRLAMMGARAIVDMYMNDTVGDIGGFPRKLGQLVSAGYLSLQDRNVLETALEAGHAAAHRGHIPSSDEINHVIDIVENLLQKVALEGSARALRLNTPSRLPIPLPPASEPSDS